MPNNMIWLLRHARADAGDKGMEDIDRPLSHDGRHQAMRLGEWMQQQQWFPGLIISSPAVRARQTAEEVCRALGCDPLNVHYDPGLYLASQQRLIEIIESQTSYSEPIMLVGHNPGLEELLTWLCSEPLPRTADGKLMTTANLARIRLDEPLKLAEGRGKLLDLSRADDLG